MAGPLGFTTALIELKNVSETKPVAWSAISNAWNVAKNAYGAIRYDANDPNLDEDTKKKYFYMKDTGVFEKGDSKFKKDLWKSVPYARTYYTLFMKDPF
jgi:hypothetical protein